MKNEKMKNRLVSYVLADNVEETFKTGCRFVSLIYTNDNEETSRYNIIMGIRVKSLYQSDLRTLEAIQPTLKDIELVACNELISSIKESLSKGIGNNSAYTLKGHYEPITANGEVSYFVDEDGKTLLYLRGYVIKKTVLVEGIYKKVNSSEKTLVKKKLEKTLKRGKIRTFKIDVNKLSCVKLNGMTVELS